jgi:hypothetical protein
MAPAIQKHIAPASLSALAVQSPLCDRFKTGRPIRLGALFARPYNRGRTPTDNGGECFLCSVACSEFCGKTRKRESASTPLLVVGLCWLARTEFRVTPVVSPRSASRAGRELRVSARPAPSAVVVQRKGCRVPHRQMAVQLRPTALELLRQAPPFFLARVRRRGLFLHGRSKARCCGSWIAGRWHDAGGSRFFTLTHEANP